MNLADIRREYQQAPLVESGADADPMVQFGKWFQDAVRADVPEPNAMTLATADGRGRPTARIVLLKDFAAGAFVFFTDYRSRKGRELDANPHAALVFHWHALERQVRVTGTTSRLDVAASAAYFRSRPRGSQLGALASEQSTVIAGRDELERTWAALAEQYTAGEVPAPPYWGGIRLVPGEIEFWQGRPNRLHDRLLYTRTSESGWHRARLSP